MDQQRPLEEDYKQSSIVLSGSNNYSRVQRVLLIN